MPISQTHSKAEHNEYITSLLKNHSKGFAEHLAYLHGSGYVRRLQRDLLARLLFILDNISILMPALAMDMYSPERRNALGPLRIFRDEFDNLKIHYVDSFELCHKMLVMLVGYINITHHGDYSVFPATKPKDLDCPLPKNMKQYERATSFNKACYFESLPKLNIQDMPIARAAWPVTLDRSLRNHIGHHSTRHDLATGNLVHDDGTTLPYVDFLLQAFKLTPMLVFAQHVLKMACMLYGPENPGEARASLQ